MPEARFGGRPPSVFIHGALAKTDNTTFHSQGAIPPWELLAGGRWLAGTGSLRRTVILPAVTWKLSGTVEAKGDAPLIDGTFRLGMRAKGPFRPDVLQTFNIPWPAGETSISFERAISVSGYNDYSYFTNQPVDPWFIGWDWLVIG